MSSLTNSETLFPRLAASTRARVAMASSRVIVTFFIGLTLKHRYRVSVFSCQAAGSFRLRLPRPRYVTKALRVHGEVHLVLETGILALDDHGGVVRDDVAHGFHPRPLGLGKVAKHVRVDQLLGAGMANADADPPVVVAHMGRNRAQAVMARDAAAGFNTHLGGRQVDLVVEDHDVTEVDLVEMRRLPDCQAGLVHVGTRQQQGDALAVDRTFGSDPAKAPSPRANPVAAGNGFDRHEADIMTIAGIARARIAEPDQELHGTPNL